MRQTIDASWYAIFVHYRSPGWPVTMADDFCGEAVRKGSDPGAGASR